MKLDMVGIIVKNMEKAVQFYELLGFTPIGDQTQAYVELTNQGVRISLNTREMITSIYGFEPDNKGEKIELAFLCDTPDEVDDIAEKMSSVGYTIFKTPWDAFWGQRYAIIEDPDGNLLSIFAANN